MKNKTSFVGIVMIMLAMCFAPWNVASAENSLVQLDIKKSDDSSLDMTFYTTESYSDSIVVRKKSDNKYTILIPKVSSSGYSRPNLNGVKEMISDVDIKNVDDGINGYTKVTIVTTKPLNIKTQTKTSGPYTSEQKEYASLMAQANAIKNKTVNKTSEQQKPVQQKAQATVAKTETPKAETTKVSAAKNELAKTETPKKPEIKLKEVDSKDLVQQKPVEKPAQPKLTIREKLENKLGESGAELENIVPDTSVVITPTINNTINNPEDIADLEKTTVSTFMTNIKTFIANIRYDITRMLPVGISPVLVFILIPIIALFVIAKLIKASLTKSRELKAAFIANVSKHQPILNKLEYNNIVNDKNLNWRDKYKKYLQESSRKEQPAKRSDGNNYAFIKQTEAVVDELEQKRKSLEQMVKPDGISMPDQVVMPESVKVYSEEDAIKRSFRKLKKTNRLKAFENPISPSNRDRIKQRKSRFKTYENPVEVQGNTLNPDDSILHTNQRQLENANLNVSELTGKRKAYPMKEYIMSSADEFFSIIDSEPKIINAKETKMKKVTNPLVSGLSQIRPAAPKIAATNSSKSVNNQMTDPISKLRDEKRKENDLIVKSGYSIDDKKGFYLVDLEGNTSLVGKINEEVFVLKNFGKNVESSIQVRRDKDNVYMVKADSFKSLVEVDENKMGVLIEL